MDVHLKFGGGRELLSHAVDGVPPAGDLTLLSLKHQNAIRGQNIDHRRFVSFEPNFLQFTEARVLGSGQSANGHVNGSFCGGQDALLGHARKHPSTVIKHQGLFHAFVAKKLRQQALQHGCSNHLTALSPSRSFALKPAKGPFCGPSMIFQLEIQFLPSLTWGAVAQIEVEPIFVAIGCGGEKQK
jgi:hypothetical protein